MVLWAEAMKGINASKDDVLDLIEEVCHLRAHYEGDAPNLPKTRNSLTPFPDPWSDEWPGNP